MTDTVSITSGLLSATINPLGAELLSLTDADSRELMTNADPAFWAGHAPLLFPNVGRLNDDTYRLDDRVYHLPQHGFARHQMFEMIEAQDACVSFRLSDNAETRSHYPFAFLLDMMFAVEGATLSMAATVRNRGDVPMPFSFGYHPAFAWPLPFGGNRASHRIAFEADEPAPLCAITAGALIAAHTKPSPVKANILALSDDLFVADALVWNDLNSRSLTYGVPGQPVLDMSFPDTPWLGIWTKPGAAFLCVEPWAGMADPDGYTGDFRDKPGVMILAPGDARTFRMNVALNLAHSSGHSVT
jgi:galactose mutarotase-like enzyme